VLNTNVNVKQQESPRRRADELRRAGLQPPAQKQTQVPPNPPRAAFDVVALAASAGGLQALTKVLAGLGADFPASVVVVQHLDPRHRSLMAEILGRRTPLPVRKAENGETMQAGRVYIAPPDQHLLVNPDETLSLTHTELVHFVRPSADLLFESVAASYKERAVAVVLSGTGTDGALGVQAIKEMGGIVIAQDTNTAEFSGMPEAAIHTGKVDFILPLDEIASTLIRLTEAGK
jgi:two-component system chemotaxis response regulator CheB